jgi:FtsH-binding integral membrane protein
MRLQGPGGAQLSPAAARSISLEELTRELQTFQATGLRSVRIEIGACIVVALMFALMAWTAPTATTRVGLGLIVCSALFVGGFLFRLIRRRVRPPPAADFAQTLALYRAGLQAAQKLSRTYAFWYVLPLSLGPLVIVIGEGIQKSDPRHAVIGVAFIAVLGGLLVALHGLMARGLQKRLDQLDSTHEKPC